MGDRIRSAGWVRVAVAIVLLAAIVAIIALNTGRAPQATVPAAPGKPQADEKTRKPAPNQGADPRDTARERPGRDRTER